MKNNFTSNLQKKWKAFYFDAITTSGIILFTVGVFMSGWLLLMALD